MKNLSNNFELIIMFLIFLWAFLYLHQSNKDTYFIEKNDLKEIVIENVVSLNSMRNNSKKYPVSGVAILQNNNLRHFDAHCIGIEDFCNINQITSFSDRTTITLLWTKNHFDSIEYDIKTGLIKEIKTSKEIIFQAKEEQIDKYISFMHEKFFFAVFAEMVAFLPCLWILMKIFFEIFIQED